MGRRLFRASCQCESCENLEKAMIYCEKGLKFVNLYRNPRITIYSRSHHVDKSRILYKKNELSQAIRLGRQAHDILKQGIYGSIARKSSKLSKLGKNNYLSNYKMSFSKYEASGPLFPVSFIIMLLTFSLLFGFLLVFCHSLVASSAASASLLVWRK